jgi:predicted O-methyltransferase YrrM
MSLNEAAIVLAANKDIYKIARWAPAEELEFCSQLALKSEITRIIECGTANGWSASYFASKSFLISTFDIVDRAKIYLDPKLEKLIDPEIRKRITFVYGDFHKEFKPIEESALYFIDGEHTRGAVLRDFRAIQTSLKRNDIIVFDDINEEGCLKALLKIATEADLEFERHYFSDGRRKIGVLYWTK